MAKEPTANAHPHASGADRSATQKGGISRSLTLIKSGPALPPTGRSTSLSRSQGLVISLVSFGIVAVLLLTGLPVSAGFAGAVISAGADTNLVPSTSAAFVSAPPNLLPLSAGLTSPIIIPQATPTAVVNISALSKARTLPWAFWGVNIAAPQAFTDTDAANVAATPVNFLRFPGGITGEEFNYTSGVITSSTNGSTSKSVTSTAEFVTSCNLMHCHA